MTGLADHELRSTLEKPDHRPGEEARGGTCVPQLGGPFFRRNPRATDVGSGQSAGQQPECWPVLRSCRPSPAARMHLQVRVLAERADRDERGPAVSATRSSAPRSVRARQTRARMVAGRRATRRAAAARAGRCRPAVETEEPQAVRRQPAPVAGAAEGLRRRGDDAEDRAVRKPEPLRGRGALLDDRLRRPRRPPAGRAISGARDDASGDQRVAPPTSMYSMKRTSAPTPSPNSSRATSSSSLTPRMTTVSILSASKPALDAASIPREDGGELVEARERGGSGRASSVSRLTVTRCRPALRSVARLLREQNAVGRQREVGERGTPRQRSTRAGRSRRTSGSPPVSRTPVHAAPENASTMRADLLEVSRSSRGSQAYSSSGMQ